MLQIYLVIESNCRPMTGSMPSAFQHNLRALIVCLAGTTPQPPVSPITATTVVCTPTVIQQGRIMRGPTARATQLVAALSTMKALRGRSSIRGTALLKV